MPKIIKSKKAISSEKVNCVFYDISYSIHGKKFILGEKPSIKIDGNDYNNIKIAGKGGNATVFLLTPISLETADPIALKISSYFGKTKKHSKIARHSKIDQRLQRFDREISALYKVKKERGNTHVVEIFNNGEVELAVGNAKTEIFPFYTMEYSDKSLRESLSKDGPFTLQQKVLLCQDLYKNLKVLHNSGIYHRDIKSDNILYCDEVWKIGDLGLISYRDSDDIIIDDHYEKIGPVARLSPEAANKHLGMRQMSEYSFDHTIDHFSDIFQLGLLFWYICQGEIPVGNLHSSDFHYYNDYPELYDDILLPMLQYAKNRRPDPLADDFAEQLSKIAMKLGA